MSSGKNPCPGCRKGRWDLTSNGFRMHFRRYCTKSFLKHPALATGAKRSHITFDNHSHPTVPRNALMASDTLTSHAVFENAFESEGSPPDTALPQETGDEGLHTSPHRPGIDTRHDAANRRDKKGKHSAPPTDPCRFKFSLWISCRNMDAQ